MGMLSFIFSLLLLPSVSLAASVGSCPGVGGVVQDVVFLEHQDCDLASGLSDVFNSMAKNFGIAPQVSLVIGGASDNASFDNGRLIQVPYRMVFYGKFGRAHEMPRHSIYVSAAHEYGHAIFHQRMKEAMQEDYGDMFTKLEQLSERKLAVFKGASDVSFVGDSIALMATEEFSHWHSIITAYAEFYADALAVFHFQDKSAMFKALYYDGMNDFFYNYVRMRDFASDPASDWYHLMSEDHAKFALARAFVGKNMWPKDAWQFASMEGSLVGAVMSVMLRELDADEKEADYELANAELIRELQKDIPFIRKETFAQ